MSPAARLGAAGLAPLLIAGVAIVLRQNAVIVLAVTGAIAAVIAVFTGLLTAVPRVDLRALIPRLLAGMLLRLLLTGAAALILTDRNPSEALAIILVLAGGVAAAVLCEALLLIPQSESVRA